MIFHLHQAVRPAAQVAVVLIVALAINLRIEISTLSRVSYGLLGER